MGLRRFAVANEVVECAVKSIGTCDTFQTDTHRKSTERISADKVDTIFALSMALGALWPIDTRYALSLAERGVAKR